MISAHICGTGWHTLKCVTTDGWARSTSTFVLLSLQACAFLLGMRDARAVSCQSVLARM
jgi:hypothetical protein